MDLDASAVGNHEFDQGFADLADRVIGDPRNAQWDYLGANVYQSDGTTPALPEYALYARDGLTVGVIGAVTQETPALVSPGGVAGLVFGDPVDAVNRVAAQLSDGNPANGEADVLVATYHEGAPTGEPATLESQVAASPVFAKIVNETSPLVDAIFTGHTHVPYAWEGPVPGQPGVTRPIVQTGSYGDRVGEVALDHRHGHRHGDRAHAAHSSLAPRPPPATPDRDLPAGGGGQRHRRRPRSANADTVGSR